MALVQITEDRVVDRFDRADDEQASTVAQARQMFFVLAKMLNLDGDVVRDAWKFTMEFVNQFQCVTNPVKEVRIAKGNMLRDRRNLLADISHHHVATHDAKDPLVDRHDRAMPAKMLAAATRFG